MATTLQQVQDRATAWSTANGGTSLVSNRPVVIARIAAIERKLFDRAAKLNSYYYAVRASANSTNAASGRTVDLSAIAPTTAPVKRLVAAFLPSGVEINRVDFRDTSAELAPRAFVRGKSLVEVGSDWGASGVVAVTVDYVRHPAPLSTTGDLTQNVSIEDAYADLLELGLAWWIAHTDEGRETPELTRLKEEMAERLADYDDHLAGFSGEAARQNIIESHNSGG